MYYTKFVYKSIIFLFLILYNISYSQTDSVLIPKSIFSINIQGGYSDISGFIGANLNIKNIGFDIGISTISWEHNDEFHRKPVIGAGLTYYFKGISNQNFSVLHPYISMGYKYKCEYDILSSYNTMFPHPFSDDIIWNNSAALIFGCIINSNYAPFSCKLGLGYQTGTPPLAIDFIFKYRIFNKIISN